MITIINTSSLLIHIIRYIWFILSMHMRKSASLSNYDSCRQVVKERCSAKSTETPDQHYSGETNWLFAYCIMHVDYMCTCSASNLLCKSLHFE